MLSQEGIISSFSGVGTGQYARVPTSKRDLVNADVYVRRNVVGVYILRSFRRRSSASSGMTIKAVSIAGL
jgi:hypothetical protein